MKNLLVVDIETTGNNPNRHQMYEFAGVPVLDGIIRQDLALHFYIRHDEYLYQREVLLKFGERVTKKPDSVMEIVAGDFYNKFSCWLKSTFTKRYQDDYGRVTLAGKNVSGFDLQFMVALAPPLRRWDTLSYSCFEIGQLYSLPDDQCVPSLKTCRFRALHEGATLKYDNTHTALDDAMLTSELYSWKKFNTINIKE